MSDQSLLRSQRKKDHVESFAKHQFDTDNYFREIVLMHNALPEINYNTIDTSHQFLGQKVSFPIMINAMTGGYDDALKINKSLAQVAKILGIPMAVGSQSIAVKDPNYSDSFKIVRETMGSDGLVLGNLNGFASLEDAKRAVEMLGANALQIHLNPAQEICMAEGDRDFRGIRHRIETFVSHLDVPIVVKEVGFGISAEVAHQLYDCGVAYVDVAGSGGTNFIKIEDARNQEADHFELYEWGIPTALSLIEVSRLSKHYKRGLTCSGGIRSADEVTKALVIGADMIGISGPVLKHFLDSGIEGSLNYLTNIIEKTKMMMLLLGVEDINTLRTVPYRLKGNLKALVEGSHYEY